MNNRIVKGGVKPLLYLAVGLFAIIHNPAFSYALECKRLSSLLDHEIPIPAGPRTVRLDALEVSFLEKIKASGVLYKSSEFWTFLPSNQQIADSLAEVYFAIARLPETLELC